MEYGSLNSKLVTVYIEAYDSVPDNSDINIILCTKSKITDTTRKRFEKYVEDNNYTSYNCIIYDIDDIEKRYNILELEDEYVKEDKIHLCEASNKLIYDDESGFIVNIKASSLKKLYNKYQGKGLFNLNLREHIPNKGVDSGIDKTIKNEPQNFWFYNNGITIACTECNISGYMCHLYNFSIINGAQTTSKIGTSELITESRDFAVVCKIVVVKTENILEVDEFINRISEASNSQKPIIPRDLKANRNEQRMLQLKAKENQRPLAIEIKRGIKANNYYSVEKWQRITNEEIGQLVLACILQKPGTARSGKRNIFTSQSVYNEVFKRKMDYDTLYDLVHLSEYYKRFKVKFTNEENDPDKIAVCRNGKFIILSIIFFILKIKRNLIKTYTDPELLEDNIEGSIIKNYKEDDFEELLYELFDFLIEIINDIYSIKKQEMKLTSHSNFFKTDKTYQQIILHEITERILKRKRNKANLDDCFIIFDI